MDHEETHPTEPHAPSYAAVADPSVSTDVHHEEPQEPQPAQEHHSKPAHHGKHRHRGKKRERPPSPTPAPPAKRAPGTPSYAHVADPEVSTQVGETAEDGESLLNALGASSMELQRILAGDDKVPGGYVLNPEGAGDDVQDGQVQAAAEEEHEVSPTEPTKEAGETIYQLMPLDPSPGKWDPSKSPKELNEVKSSKQDGTVPKKERTVLQKHCDFFDPDGDGVIWPWDTFFGFWVLGYALPICIFAVFAIHGPFSWPTQPRFPLPDLFWRIYIDRITAAKHGSDSGSYDREGGFDQTAFDKMFQANAKMRPDALTGKELFHLIRRNRVVYDPFGWVAGLFEWVSVWLLFWPGDNLFRKSDIKKLYDGTLFYETAYSQKMKGRFTPPGWRDTVTRVKNQ